MYKCCWTCKRYYEEQDESGTIYCYCALYDCEVDNIVGVIPSNGCDAFLESNDD